MSDRVSVIIPTYEREAFYLNRAIESLMNQTHSNVEIIVIDDNLNDSSFRRKMKDYIEAVSENQAIIYHENQNNIGGALSRNKGIELATGDYITFLDDDDEYLPQKIEKQLEFMKEFNYDMSFTNLTLVNEQKVIIDYRDHNYVTNFSKNQLLKTHIMRKLTGTPTFMYKKSKLVEIGGFDDVPIGQEFHLMLKTIEHNLVIGHLNRSDVIAYRHNQGGISFGKTKIDGEKNQYKFIKTNYFDLFTFKEKMFIRFRYHLVFALAYKRNKQYVRALIYLVTALINSPLDSVKEAIKFYKTVYSKRNGTADSKKADVS